MIIKRPFFIISNIVGGWFFELKNGEKKSLKKAMIWRINVILTNDELIFSKAVLCKNKAVSNKVNVLRPSKPVSCIPGTSKLRGAGPLRIRPEIS